MCVGWGGWERYGVARAVCALPLCHASLPLPSSPPYSTHAVVSCLRRRDFHGPAGTGIGLGAPSQACRLRPVHPGRLPHYFLPFALTSSSDPFSLACGRAA